jgi:hypothetical protein
LNKEKKLAAKRERITEKLKQIEQHKQHQKGNFIKEPKFFEIKDGQEFYQSSANKRKSTNDILKNQNLKKLPFGNRIKHLKSSDEGDQSKYSTIVHENAIFRNENLGNKQMTFISKQVV